MFVSGGVFASSNSKHQVEHESRIHYEFLSLLLIMETIMDDAK